MRKEPEIITVTLKKQNGMGLSIVAAKVWKSVYFNVIGKSLLFLISRLWKMLTEKSISLKFVLHITLIILLFWLGNVSVKYTDVNNTRKYNIDVVKTFKFKPLLQVY